jgi:predicted Zn-dependent protease
MQRAGWNPNGMLTFFERLRAQEKDPGLLEALLSTHPPTRDRATGVAAELKVMPQSSGLSENSFAFLAMKAGLQLLPAAPKQQRRARP